MDQYIGKLLDNRYEILELIGVGGMARVYKARCHWLNRYVAIKILRDDLAQDSEIRRRFHDESQAVAMLSHPNIVAVYDVSRASDQEYIVMELIDGITLKQYMQRKGNKLSWREALHFITQIVKALGHAHSRGIIHRDIKPHNIMVLRDGSVKVADFGIARVSAGGHSTLTQEALGSVHYISPEQARGSRIDARSDLYSAGVVLYEMITGRLPFEGDNPVSVAIQHINSIPLSPREIDPELPEALEAITMKAMAPNPDDRYLSADEMLADLEEFRKNPNINFDFGPTDFLPAEEVEELERTQIRPVTPAHRTRVEEKKSHRRAVHEGEEDEEGERRSALPVVAAVGVILAFVVGVFYFLYATFASGLFTPTDSYPVPNLKGMLFDKVVQDETLLGEHFTVELGSTVSDDQPAGTIIGQTPSENASVKETMTTITVTVSSGPEIIKMIDVTNKEYLKAVSELTNLGLEVVTPYTYRSSSEIAKDHIIEYSPAQGTTLSPGDEVTIVISSGPEVKTVKLSDYKGKTQTWVEDDLKLRNLVPNIQAVYSDTVEAGTVITQYPDPGTEVDEGSTVNIQVSKGKDPATLPKTVTKEISVAVPPDAGTVNIKVTMDGEIVYDNDVDTLMHLGDITFELTGSGTKVLSVYYNGELDHTQTVEFSQ